MHVVSVQTKYPARTRRAAPPPGLAILPHAGPARAAHAAAGPPPAPRILRRRASPLAVLLLALALAAGLRPSPARAEDSHDTAPYLKINTLIATPEKCVVDFTVDYDIAMAHMADIRTEMLSTSNDVDYYRKHALSIIYLVIDHAVGTYIAKSIYTANPPTHADTCHFSTSVTKADDFGHPKLYRISSWDFTAAVAAKIDWDHFQFANLPKVVLNFTFDKQADQLLNETHESFLAGDNGSDAPPTSCADLTTDVVKRIFNGGPYAQSHHLQVIDASEPRQAPPRPRRGLACTSRLATTGGALNVLVEPTRINGKWFWQMNIIP